MHELGFLSGWKPGQAKMRSDKDIDAFIAGVRSLCDHRNSESDKPYYVDISVGCQELRAGDMPGGLKHALKQADGKLYEAKAVRRKNVVKESLSE